MKNSILVNEQKRQERTKQLQIDQCWKQRDRQIRNYQRKNPFSFSEWNKAFHCGWLTQHGIRYWKFPSPAKHQRNLWFVNLGEIRKNYEKEFKLLKEASRSGWLIQHRLSFWDLVFSLGTNKLWMTKE